MSVKFEACNIQRSQTCIGLTKNESFYLPPELYRSVSVDHRHWLSEAAPPAVRGRLGAYLDLICALYLEIPVLAPLVAKLVRLLGLGIRAYTMLFRLTLFAFALSPAISKIGYWWWRSSTIVRSICYGPNPRNYLDVYLPSDSSLTSVPVVIYITGGAWIIGYKAWAAPLGDYWSRKNLISVSVDYRNFPQGTFSDMVTDVETAIQWTVDNVARFGGDPTNITLVGQSAGAHIAAYILLNRHKETSGWTVGHIKHFVGVSGPYDIVSIAPRLNKRGLYTNLLKSIMNTDFFSVSPSRIVLSTISLCPVLLLHGTSDISVPFESSVAFHKALLDGGHTKSTLELWAGVGHTDPIVEGPAEGRNYLALRVAEIAFMPFVKSAEILSSKPIMNSFMVRIGRFLMPF